MTRLYKHCSGPCDSVIHLTARNFYKSKKSKDGFAACCKACHQTTYKNYQLRPTINGWIVVTPKGKKWLGTSKTKAQAKARISTYLNQLPS